VKLALGPSDVKPNVREGLKQTHYPVRMRRRRCRADVAAIAIAATAVAMVVAGGALNGGVAAAMTVRVQSYHEITGTVGRSTAPARRVPVGRRASPGTSP